MNTGACIHGTSYPLGPSCSLDIPVHAGVSRRASNVWCLAAQSDSAQLQEEVRCSGYHKSVGCRLPFGCRERDQGSTGLTEGLMGGLVGRAMGGMLSGVARQLQQQQQQVDHPSVNAS